MARITFLKANISIDVKEGSELLKVSEANPQLPLRFGCTRGDCGVCAIRIVDGAENLTKMSLKEKATLLKKGRGEGYRLACQCALNGDIAIE